jgi:hypothetical protein
MTTWINSVSPYATIDHFAHASDLAQRPGFVEKLADVAGVVMRVTSRFTVCRSNVFGGVKRQRGT